jgi:imidazolonepropionase-like amidohydrolase
VPTRSGRTDADTKTGGTYALAQKFSSAGSARNERIVIAASTVFDGRQRLAQDTRILIEGSTIVSIDQAEAPVDYDLRRFTVLPGWIDAHVHITWSFGQDGKNARAGKDDA